MASVGLNVDLTFAGIDSRHPGGNAALRVFLRGLHSVAFVRPDFQVSRPSGISQFVQYTPDLFGDYFESGTFNGRPLYRRSTDHGYTFTDDVMRYNGTAWEVVDASGAGWRAPDADAPPPVTWTTALGGATPANGIRVEAGTTTRLFPDQQWRARHTGTGQLLGEFESIGNTESKLVAAIDNGEPLFPGDRLTDGAVTVSIESNNTAGLPSNTIAYSFQSIVDFGVLDYDRQLVGQQDCLGFGGLTGRHNYAVGLIDTATDPLLFEISDPTQPIQLGFAAPPSGDTVRFGYDAGVAAPCFYLCAASAVRELPPADMRPAEILNLASTFRQTDYILIVPETFEGDPAFELLEHRAQPRHGEPGLQVLLATVESIYDEFGYGVKDPAAIRQFLGFAYHHYQSPRPRYVLLAGDGHYDPVLRSGKLGGLAAEQRIDHIPAHFGPMSHEYTAIDPWYTSVDGQRFYRGRMVLDAIPDMAIGRLPVHSLAELQDLVDKIRRYEGYASTGGFRDRGILVADDPDGPCSPDEYPTRCQTFDLISNELFDLLPQAPTDIDRLYLLQGNGNLTDLRNRLLSPDSGFGHVGFVNYIGHGSAKQWTSNPLGSKLFTYEDAANLRNTNLCLVSIMVGPSGVFHIPEDRSIAEALLRPDLPDRGAVGVFAPTSFTGNRTSRRLVIEYYNAMMNDTGDAGECRQGPVPVFNQPHPRVGDCYLNALRAVCADLGYQDTAQVGLFMDPAMLHRY